MGDMSNEKLQNILAILAINEKLWAFEKKRPFRLLFNVEELNFCWGGIRTRDPVHAILMPYPLEKNVL